MTYYNQNIILRFEHLHMLEGVCIHILLDDEKFFLTIVYKSIWNWRSTLETLRCQVFQYPFFFHKIIPNLIAFSGLRNLFIASSHNDLNSRPDTLIYCNLLIRRESMMIDLKFIFIIKVTRTETISQFFSPVHITFYSFVSNCTWQFENSEFLLRIFVL